LRNIYKKEEQLSFIPQNNVEETRRTAGEEEREEIEERKIVVVLLPLALPLAGMSAQYCIF
jgi:hypothetical protein